MTQSNGTDQIERDDEHWLTVLAGLQIIDEPPPDPVTLAEAHSLRQALIRQENDIDRQLEPILAQGVDSLLERLRLESLLSSRLLPSQTTGSWYWPAGWAIAGSLVVLLVFGTLAPQVFERDGLQITQGANQNALLMRVEDPLRHAQQVAISIRQAGGKVHIRKLPNGHVMLYAEATPDVMAMMRQHNMNPPMEHGMFVIAFVPMQDTEKKDATPS
jgi:hypothetical protein